MEQIYAPLAKDLKIKNNRMTQKEWNKLRTRTHVFSRVCGYLQAVDSYNPGRVAEFEERKTFDNQLKDETN